MTQGARPGPTDEEAELRRLLAGKRCLLVASTGGHLAQLVRWSQLFRVHEDSVFATFDSPQSRSLLTGRRVVLLDYVPPRGARQAVAATARLARRTRGARFDAVLTTGAAVSLAAYAVSRLRRIPIVYIESVSRFDGPSATGRILERLPGVRRFSQHRAWAGRAGWRLGPSLLDDYTASPRAVAPAPATPGRSVFVSLGTIRPYRFDALVDAVRDQLRPEDEVTWQVGVTDRSDLPGRSSAEVDAEAFDRLVAESDVFITHAGVGTLLRALELGVRPVVVPRRSTRGEHVDDHQLQVARELADRGLVLLREPDELSSADFEPADVSIARATDTQA